MRKLLYISIFLYCFALETYQTELFDGLILRDKLIVPNIVHQTYDYSSPSFLFYLSVMCVQRYLKPSRHILWVNDEGRHRKGHWDNWQRHVKEGTWEHNLTTLMSSNKLEVKMLAFPTHPPGNDSIFAHQKAHHSDFVRMNALQKMGGIYLDTDAFVIDSLDSLRIYNFTMPFDNVVNPDKTAAKRVNNGVLLSTPHARFLALWLKHYAQHMNPHDFSYDSSTAPYHIATQYPDLIHIEMNRISPISYGLDTSRLAAAITCGILVPPVYSADKTTLISKGGIWHPTWNKQSRSYSYENVVPDTYMFAEVSKKLVLHLTQSGERGICQLRKLGSPDDLSKLPSLLGRIFRIAHYGYDDYNYNQYSTVATGNKQQQQEMLLGIWNTCRSSIGLVITPDSNIRQQYLDDISTVV